MWFLKWEANFYPHLTWKHSKLITALSLFEPAGGIVSSTRPCCRLASWKIFFASIIITASAASQEFQESQENKTLCSWDNLLDRIRDLMDRQLQRLIHWKLWSALKSPRSRLLHTNQEKHTGGSFLSGERSYLDKTPDLKHISIKYVRSSYGGASLWRADG